MAREEERRQYVKERERNIPITSSEANLIIEGAKWADETMIEKACKWLEKNRDELSRVNTSGFIELFKKAMEE